MIHQSVACIQQAAMIEGRFWALLSLSRAVVCNSLRSLGQ